MIWATIAATQSKSIQDYLFTCTLKKSHMLTYFCWATSTTITLLTAADDCSETLADQTLPRSRPRRSGCVDAFKNSLRLLKVERRLRAKPVWPLRDWCTAFRDKFSFYTKKEAWRKWNMCPRAPYSALKTWDLKRRKGIFVLVPHRCDLYKVYTTSCTQLLTNTLELAQIHLESWLVYWYCTVVPWLKVL